MKIFGLIIFLILGLFGSKLPTSETVLSPNSEAYIILPDSRLTILGSTNINNFKCNFDISELKNPITISYSQKEDNFIFSKASLKLKNQSFDCGSRPINKDFLSLLKTENYPEITLRLKELSLNDDPSQVKALVEIEIAGISKVYNVNVSAAKDNTFVVSGFLKLNIEDFNLQAPKKVLGLIIVEKIIDIEFKLKLSPYS